MPRLHALVSWPNRHRGGCLLLLLLVYLALCLINPVAFSLTHPLARNCGNFDYGGGTASLPSVRQQAARCIIQAHQLCHPATLQVNSYGTDRFSQAVLATAKGIGGCQLTVGSPPGFGIVDVLENAFPLNVLDPQETTCQSLSLQSTGLFLQSCERDGHRYESLQVLWWGNP